MGAANGRDSIPRFRTYEYRIWYCNIRISATNTKNMSRKLGKINGKYVTIAIDLLFLERVVNRVTQMWLWLCCKHTKLHEFISIIQGCWAIDPHKRPSFAKILQDLEAIAVSGFGEQPNESFHAMQDGWRKEITEVLQELRVKEKVNFYQ